MSTDVLFSLKIVEGANENNNPWDMTANASGWGVGKRNPHSPLASRSHSRARFARVLVGSSGKKSKTSVDNRLAMNARAARSAGKPYAPCLNSTLETTFVKGTLSRSLNRQNMY